MRRLELFGSAGTARFDPARSDVDLLVEFEPGVDLGPWLTRFHALREELERVFDRPVDLILTSATRSPHLRREIDAARSVLYAA